MAKTGLYNQVRIEDATLNGVTLTSGDEIAVYDSLLCVGATKVDNFPVNVTASLGGDYVEGAEPGRKMKFRIWDKETDREFFVVDYPGVDTNVKFSQGGTFSKQYPLTIAEYIKAWVRNVVFNTVPSNLIYFVNDVQYSRKDTLSFGEGDTLDISTQDIQPVSSDTRYNFHYWNGVAATQCTKVDTIYAVESSGNNITANFQKEFYLQLKSDHGVPSGEGWYVAGQDVDISINSPVYNDIDGKRYAFTQWEEEYGSQIYSAADTTVSLDEPMTLVSQWKTQYRLTIEQDPPAGGDVTIDGDALENSVNWKDSDTVVGVKTTVNRGNNYEFTGWSGSVISSDTSITLSMTKPKSLTAHYKRFVNHTINTQPSGLDFYIDGNKYDTEQTNIKWDENSTHNLKVDSILYDETNPNKRYVFTHWTTDETITSSEYNYQVTTPANSLVITANFKVQYKVDIESEHGTVSLVDEEETPIEDGWCDGNTSVIFSVFPDTIETTTGGKRFVFDGWKKGNDDSYTGKDNPHTIFVNNFIEEEAQWKTEFKLSITEFQDKGGDVKLNPDHLSQGGWYVKNTDVELDITLASGYEWFGWSGDITTDTHPVNVSMDTSKNIIANFAKEVEVTIDSDPTSLDFEVIPYDSEEPETYTTPHTFTWLSAREYHIRVDSTIILGPDSTTRYTIESWSNHSGQDTNYAYIVPDFESSETIIVDYLIEYFLDINSTHDGVDRGDPFGKGWYKADTVVEFGIEDSISSGTAGTRYKYLEWTGTGNGSYSGSDLSHKVTMTNPIKEEATWVTQYNFSIQSEYGTYWVSPSRNNRWYEQGVDVSFSMETDDLVELIGPGLRYAFTGWEINYNGTIQTISDTSYTVTMNTPVEVEALWPLQYYLETVKVPPEGGEIDPPTPGAWYESDTYAEVDTVQVNEGYNWNGWSISGSVDDNCPKSILMDGPKRVEALFGETTVCVITTSPPGLQVSIDGSNYTAPQSRRWLQGSSHTLSVQDLVEDDYVRYSFNSWNYGLFRTFSYTVKATVDTDSVTAYFDTRYKLTVNTDHSTASGTGWYDEKKQASFRVMDETIDNSNSRYQFNSWEGVGYNLNTDEWEQGNSSYTGDDISYYVTMNNPIIETAVWDTLYQLSVTQNIDTAGTILRKTDKNWLNKGAEDTLTAVPAENGSYEFDHWSGDIGSNDPTSSTIYIVMDGAKSIQANFTGVYHTLTTEILPRNTCGSIIVTPEQSQYLHASEITIEAVPNSGYVFSHWEGGVDGTSRTANFTIVSDATVIAHFEGYDATPPQVTDCYPPRDANQVPVNTDIEFKVVDNVYGVDRSTLDVTVAGSQIINNGQIKTGVTVALDPVERGYKVFYSPSAAFDTSSVVSVNVKSSDTAQNPNLMNYTYQFTIGASSIENKITETFVPSSARVIEHDSGFKVTIPAGALPDTTDIIIGVLDNPPALPDTINGVGLMYYLWPEGLEFSSPITVSFPIDSTTLSQSGVFSIDGLKVLYFSTVTGSWEEVDVVSVSETEVTIEIDHFSYFTLASWMEALAPKKFADVYNFPNPFNPENENTFIRYELSKDAEISIKIFDVSGSLVKILKEDLQCLKLQEYNCNWNGRNAQGDIVSNNVYFCVIESSAGDREVRKIAVLR
ncbi:MAG: hypothetical protein R6V04_05005 [bacterium]